MLKEPLIFLMIQPGSYFFDPSLARLGTAALVLPVVLTAGGILGYKRQTRSEGWGPVPYALAFYSMLIILWDFPSVERFLIAFLPLIAAGHWMSGGYLVKRIRLSLHDQNLKGERPAAVFLGAAVVAVLLSVSWFFWQAGVSLRRQNDLRASTLLQNVQAYSSP